MGLKKYLHLTDIHCGYEFDEEDHSFTPSHDAALLAKIARMVRWWKPDELILGGDQINLSCISRWTTGKPRMIEGRRIEEDYHFFHDLVWKPFASRIERVTWIKGNHEERLDELTLKNPQLSNLLTHRNLLSTVGIADRSMTEVYSGKLYRPGNAKVYFTHGHTFSASTNPAKKLLDAYHRSVRIGHFHHASSWTEKVAADSEDFHTAHVVPPCCKTNLPYAKNKPSSNQQGFLAGYYDDQTGNFWDHVVDVVDGKFMFEGRQF